MKTKILLNVALLFTFSMKAQASFDFSDLMKSLNGQKENVVAEVPDLNQFLKVRNLQEAEAISRQQTYPKMIAQQKISSLIEPSAVIKLVEKRNTTIVIVPGLLGEFIDTRAFEEVFSRNSTSKKSWTQLMASSSIKDARFNLELNADEQVPLSELIDVASIDDQNGIPLIKLIILRTKLGSLESIGSNVEKASLFNRRLEKYVSLTGDENLVLLGYSRGTPLALEMVTQAETQNLPYLSRVQAVVSYAGVVMGSSLADITDDQTTESGKQFAAVKRLYSSLGTSENFWDRGFQFTKNSAAITEFLAALALDSKADPKALLKSSMSGDFKTVAMLVAGVVTELGVKSVFDFNGHVNRVKRFISEILTSVEGLKTKNAVAWFQTHHLPKKIRYLSIAATMVDPLKSEIEKTIYNQKIGYNDSLDDDGLEANRRTYEKVTGFALNDSQVALHQSLFLPNLIAALNPANSDLRIDSLGVLQTHHWGVSLRVVNVMKDGRTNPFPRENALLALTAFLNQ